MKKGLLTSWTHGEIPSLQPGLKTKEILIVVLAHVLLRDLRSLSLTSPSARSPLFSAFHVFFLKDKGTRQPQNLKKRIKWPHALKRNGNPSLEVYWINVIRSIRLTIISSQWTDLTLLFKSFYWEKSRNLKSCFCRVKCLFTVWLRNNEDFSRLNSTGTVRWGNWTKDDRTPYGDIPGVSQLRNQEDSQ